MPGGTTKNIAIILIGTKHAGNIGSVARAMNNFGFSDLRLAEPQCALDEQAFRLAKRGKTILSHARTFRHLRSAARGSHLLVGTSAKTGGNRSQACSPRSAAARILEYAQDQRVSVIFGPEDTGLVDDDLKLCQMLVRIPTTSRGRSINLAQAVTILAYEIFLANLAREPMRIPKLAPLDQVEAMYSQLESALLEIGFLHPQNAGHMMFALRRLFGRAGLEAGDVGVLRGIARQIAWYGNSARGN
jgi:tRNA/rRNA methyltransferase